MFLGKFIKVLLFVGLIYGLWLIGSWQPTKEEDADTTARAKYMSYIDEIQQSFVAQVLDDLNLVCIGQSGGFHEKVDELGLRFHAYRRASIDEARALQLFLMNKLAETVNSHEKIQPFLKKIPFTNIDIGISFKSPYGSYSDGSVAHIFNVSDVEWGIENRNRLYYSSIDPLTGNLLDLFNESYEEATSLLKAPIDLKKHQTTPQEEAFDEVIYQFAKEMQERYGFECWNIGGKISDHLEEIGAHFVLVHRAMQEEAKEFIILAAETLTKIVNENEKIKPFLKELPFPPEKINMIIHFTRPDHAPYYDDSIEKVGLEGGEIVYYKDAPSTPDRKSFPLHTPVFAKENYKEALKTP